MNIYWMAKRHMVRIKNCVDMKVKEREELIHRCSPDNIFVRPSAQSDSWSGSAIASHFLCRKLAKTLISDKRGCCFSAENMYSSSCLSACVSSLSLYLIASH